jgi:hypothetical protein
VFAQQPAVVIPAGLTLMSLDAPALVQSPLGLLTAISTIFLTPYFPLEWPAVRGRNLYTRLLEVVLKDEHTERTPSLKFSKQEEKCTICNAS